MADVKVRKIVALSFPEALLRSRAPTQVPLNPKVENTSNPSQSTYIVYIYIL